MFLVSKGALRSALFCLAITSFVTACVKNDNKDGSALITDEVTLEQQSLLMTNTADGDTQSIKHSSVTRHKKIIQEWLFELKQPSDLIISKVIYTHDTCHTTDSFIYKFEIQENIKDSSGLLTSKSVPLLEKGLRQGFQSGQYILRAVLDNNGGCKNINFSFNIKVEKSSVLSYNSIIKAQYYCDIVQFTRANMNHKELIVGEHARIETSPMKVQRVSNDLHSYVNVLNIQEKSICEAVKRPTVHSCKESINIDSDIKDAKLVAQQSCRIGNNKQTTRPSILSIFENEERISMNFTCSYRNQRRNYSFSSCKTIYNLGEQLPLRNHHGAAAFDYSVKKREMVIDFKFNPSNVDMAIIPGQLYVNIYNIKKQQPVFKFTAEATRAKLTNPDGEFLLQSAPGEADIREKLKHHNLNDLHLVISREPNDYTSGIYHYPLK